MRHSARALLISIALLLSSTSIHADSTGRVDSRPLNMATSRASVCGALRQQVGQVYAVSGGLAVKHRNGPWKNVKGKKTPLLQGDTLRTGLGQRAGVKLCDGGTLYINQETQAVLPTQNTVQAQHGEIAEALTGRTGHRTVTLTGTAEARGTRFDAVVDRRGSSFVVAGGSLTVKNGLGQVVVKVNQETITRPGRPPQPPRHVDAQRTLTWTNSVGSTWRVLGSSGHLMTPRSLAVDGKGDVFVTDSGRFRVVKLSPSGQELASWGKRGTGPAQFVEPWGIALDPQGDIYVTDPSQDRIEKISPGGQLLDQLGSEGTSPGHFLGPEGIDIDSAGNIYVADSVGNRIQKLSPTGRPLAQWGALGSGPGKFDQPGDVAVDAAGNIYVADTRNNRIQKLSPDGRPLAQWGGEGTNLGQFDLPTGLALDSHGNLYVADTGNERVEELSPTGKPLQAWGVSGKAAGQFSSPGGVALDSRGQLFVADTGNNRIQVLSPAG